MRRAAIPLFAALVACGKSNAPSASAPASAAAAWLDVDGGVEDVRAAADPREAAQWEAAKDGDPEEQMRLADLVGCEGLREGGEAAGRRPTALAAMRFCHDFS